MNNFNKVLLSIKNGKCYESVYLTKNCEYSWILSTMQCCFPKEQFLVFPIDDVDKYHDWILSCFPSFSVINSHNRKIEFDNDNFDFESMQELCTLNEYINAYFTYFEKMPIEI